MTHADSLGTFARTYPGQTGQLTSQSNGVVGTTWTYDDNLHDRRLNGVASTPKASAYRFANAVEGDITAITDAFNNQTLTNSYDDADRLLGSTSSLGPAYGYKYDAAGTLGTITIPGGARSVVSNALNQVSSVNGVAYSYDADGNLTRDASRTYQWDAENRLVGIGYLSNPNYTNSFRYDGLGRRIAIGVKNNGVSGETHYGWCGQILCQARTGADVAYRRYYAEGEDTPAQNTHLYYAPDQLGSVRDALEASSGASVAHYDYDPYATPLDKPGASATDFRYAGLFDLQGSGAYLSATRPYDPVAGRWLKRDTIGEAGGFNRYRYVWGEPVGEVDPFGLDSIPDPNGVVPVGPSTAAPPSSGQLPGTLYGPKLPSGPQATSRWVPPQSEGGPKGSQGYLKFNNGTDPGFQRYDQQGNPISPGEAHPGRPSFPPGGGSPTTLSEPVAPEPPPSPAPDLLPGLPDTITPTEPGIPEITIPMSAQDISSGFGWGLGSESGWDISSGSGCND